MIRIRRQLFYRIFGGIGLIALVAACSFFGGGQATDEPAPTADQVDADVPIAEESEAAPDATFTSAPIAAAATDLPTATVYPTVAATEPPKAPIGIEAKYAAAFDVSLLWQDQAINEDGYYIYRDDLEADGPAEVIGTTPFDATSYQDTSAVCGGYYKYTISSFNMLGEGKSPVCWTVRMPECSAPKSTTLQGGAENGLSFAAGSAGANGDLYLTGGALKADQAGQLGVVDVGESAGTSLNDVSVPADAVWETAGVPLQAGHTYVVALRGGGSYAAFTVKSVNGDSAEIDYIVINPGAFIDYSGCGRTETVFYCYEVSPNWFEYYNVEVKYDGAGNVVSQTPGPKQQGLWQPGCPPARPTDQPPPPTVNSCPVQPQCPNENYQVDQASCRCFCAITENDCDSDQYFVPAGCYCQDVPK